MVRILDNSTYLLLKKLEALRDALEFYFILVFAIVAGGNHFKWNLLGIDQVIIV